ncbi:MAG: 5-(carboxyamino)imidazole ribonucleotide synthase, partial [Armatimonadota bacterium]
MPSVNALPPGSVIGILGSGQLGRMAAQSAIRMGYRVATYSPDTPPTPCAQAGAREVHGVYTDLEAVEAFAKSVDVVTFEFENVSSEATAAAARWAPVRPGGNVLHTTQHRVREKSFLSSAGVPTARFRPVHSEADLEEFPYPAILKTAGFGYDGKGQAAVGDAANALSAF